MTIRKLRAARLDVAKLRSAKELTDRDAIFNLLEEGARRMAAEGAPQVREVTRGTDGRVELRKPFGTLARVKAASADDVRRLCALRSIPWRDGYENRTVPYWASDERPDAHGDIVRQDWLFDLYEDNSPLCDSHRWEDPPIGAGLDWSVHQRADGAKYRGPALFVLALFADRETYEWADQLHRLVTAGFLKACSVGFAADVVIRVEDPAERQAVGLGPYGVILQKNHLLELSPTTLGANPGALSVLMAAKRRGELQAADVPVARELLRRDLRGNEDAWRQADRDLVEVARGMFSGLELAAADDADKPLLEHAKVARGLRTKAEEAPAAPPAAAPPAEDADEESTAALPEATTLAVDQEAGMLLLSTPDGKLSVRASVQAIRELLAAEDELEEEEAEDASSAAVLDRLANIEGALEELTIGTNRRLDEQRDLIEDLAGGSIPDVKGAPKPETHTDRSEGPAKLDQKQVERVHAVLDNLRDLGSA